MKLHSHIALSGPARRFSRISHFFMAAAVLNAVVACALIYCGWFTHSSLWSTALSASIFVFFTGYFVVHARRYRRFERALTAFEYHTQAVLKATTTLAMDAHIEQCHAALAEMERVTLAADYED